MRKDVKIFLASGSPRRKKYFGELAGRMGIDFELLPNDYDEDELKAKIPEPRELVQSLAREKARVSFDMVSNQYENIVVIGGDTVVWVDGKILGKPIDEDDAKRMLGELSGKSNEVITGLAVMFRIDGVSAVATDVCVSRVKMEKMSAADIDEYVSGGEPLDKAGAFAVFGEGSKYIENYTGDEAMVMGLDVKKLEQVLAKLLT